MMIVRVLIAQVLSFLLVIALWKKGAPGKLLREPAETTSGRQISNASWFYFNTGSFLKDNTLSNNPEAGNKDQNYS